MFQKASRKKLRFESPQGLLSVEDLWDLPLQSSKAANLDDIAKALFRKVKDQDDVSFVVKSKAQDDTLQLKFDVVKHIIDVRLAEAEVAETAKANKEKKQQILAIIAAKESEALMGSSLDELRRMAESL
jgi:hypothetical protein